MKLTALGFSWAPRPRGPGKKDENKDTPRRPRTRSKAAKEKKDAAATEEEAEEATTEFDEPAQVELESVEDVEGDPLGVAVAEVAEV